MGTSREYEVLRADIKSEYDYIQANNSILYAATGAILTFALGAGNTNYFVCLLPLFIIMPLYLRNASHHRSVIRNASYLYVFLEGDEFNWERRHHQFDITHNKKLDWKDPMRYYLLVLLCGFSAFYKILESMLKNGENLHFVAELTLSPFSMIKKLITLSGNITPVECSNMQGVIEKVIIIVLACSYSIYQIRVKQVRYVELGEEYIARWEVIKKEEAEGHEEHHG